MPTIAGQEQIKAAQLLTVIKALQLEHKGMKRKGPSAASMWRRHYGMASHTPIPVIIARIREDLVELDRLILPTPPKELVLSHPPGKV